MPCPTRPISGATTACLSLFIGTSPPEISLDSAIAHDLGAWCARVKPERRRSSFFSSFTRVRLRHPPCGGSVFTPHVGTAIDALVARQHTHGANAGWCERATMAMSFFRLCCARARRQRASRGGSAPVLCYNAAMDDLDTSPRACCVANERANGTKASACIFARPSRRHSIYW